MTSTSVPFFSFPCCFYPTNTPRYVQVPDLQNTIHASGKLLALESLLPRLKAEGHRLLMYFQMTKMMDLMEDYLTYRKYSYVRLDGSTSLGDRRDLVSDWQTRNDLFIFLLSTRAGGVGINLTAADTVVFYDSDWNPTVDRQAMDRAHRLGQTKQVTVYRLYMTGTIEAKVLERAQTKDHMQKLVIQGGESDSTSLLSGQQLSFSSLPQQQQQGQGQEQEQAQEQQVGGVSLSISSSHLSTTLYPLQEDRVSHVIPEDMNEDGWTPSDIATLLLDAVQSDVSDGRAFSRSTFSSSSTSLKQDKSRVPRSRSNINGKTPFLRLDEVDVSSLGDAKMEEEDEDNNDEEVVDVDELMPLPSMKTPSSLKRYRSLSVMNPPPKRRRRTEDATR